MTPYAYEIPPFSFPVSLIIVFLRLQKGVPTQRLLSAPRILILID